MRQLLHRRAAGPAKPEQLADLVERFPHRIVDGAAKSTMLANAFHRDALAMPAGHQQQQVGKRYLVRQQSRQSRGQRVRFEMIDRDEWQLARQGHSLGKAAAHDQPADQPWPCTGSNGAEAGIVQPGLMHHAGDEFGQMRQMRAGGNFWHYAAERRMRALAEHGFGQNPPVRRQNRSGGFIAGTLYSQHGPLNLGIRALHAPSFLNAAEVIGHEYVICPPIRPCGQLRVHP